MELISCITPTFNRNDLLKKAIQSCIYQSYQNWEMIIVDDGSSDGTEEIVANLQKRDNRIRYFKNPGKGPNAARNFGIMKSSGDYLVFLDDDDEHLPHRFKDQLDAIKRSGCKFILSGFQVKDLKTGRLIKTDFARSKGKGAGHGPRWMISRELVIKAGLFDETMAAMQEVELSYRIAEFENYAFHNSIVMVGGVNHESITKNTERIINGRLMLMEKHAGKMPLLEAAWWYYVIGLDYMGMNKMDEAEKYFKLSAVMDNRNIYRTAYICFRMMHPGKGTPGKISRKIMSFFSGFRFPQLIEHKIID